MCVWWHWPKADGQNAAVGGVDNGGRWRAALCPMRRWRFPPISTLMVGVKGGIYADGEGGLEMFPTHTDQESAMANDANITNMSGGGGPAAFPNFSGVGTQILYISHVYYAKHTLLLSLPLQCLCYKVPSPPRSLELSCDLWAKTPPRPSSWT